MKNSNFQTLMRDHCEWWTRPGMDCDKWGSAMDAAFKVSDYMAESWSEYPLDYRPGLGGAGSIIEESPECREYLDTLPRDAVRDLAKTIGRYVRILEHAGISY